jgi:hypothetical protein
MPHLRPANKSRTEVRVQGSGLEANLTSGALITANFTTEYGRQIIAVPGALIHTTFTKGIRNCGILLSLGFFWRQSFI